MHSICKRNYSFYKKRRIILVISTLSFFCAVDVADKASFVAMLESGPQLPNPPHTPANFILVMKSCWDIQPGYRPVCTRCINFITVVVLRDLITPLNRSFMNYYVVSLCPSPLHDIHKDFLGDGSNAGDDQKHGNRDTIL